MCFDATRRVAELVYVEDSHESCFVNALLVGRAAPSEA
jgi:hypothetical protein